MSLARALRRIAWHRGSRRGSRGPPVGRVARDGPDRPADTSLNEARDRVRSAVVNSDQNGRANGSPWACFRRRYPNPEVGSMRLSPPPYWPRRVVRRLACRSRVLLGSSLWMAGCARFQECSLPSSPGRGRFYRVVVPRCERGGGRVGARCAGRARRDAWGSDTPLRGEPQRLTRRHASAPVPAADALSPISPRSPASRPAAWRWNSQLPAAITSSCSAHPARVRRCSLNDLPGLLPPLSDEQALEVTAVHSLAGVLSSESPLIRRHRFAAPTTRRAWPPWSVGEAGTCGREPRALPIAACSFSTRRRSSPRGPGCVTTALGERFVIDVARAAVPPAFRLASRSCLQPTRARAASPGRHGRRGLHLPPRMRLATATGCPGR